MGSFFRIINGDTEGLSARTIISITALIVVVVGWIGYRLFIGRPRERREESKRQATRSQNEIICLLTRGGAVTAADLVALLKRNGVAVTEQGLVDVARAFGYTEPLFLNELSRRATLMLPDDKHRLVEVTLLVATADGRRTSRELAQGIVKALGPLPAKTSELAKRALKPVAGASRETSAV